MAQTIAAWHQAIMSGPKAKAAKALLARRCSGTTSRAEDQRVVFYGNHLALISWDFGEKEVVVLASPRSGYSPAVRATRARLAVPHDLPHRLTGHALAEVIAGLSRADEVWSAVLADEIWEEQAKQDAAEADEVAAAAKARRAQDEEREATRAALKLFLRQCLEGSLRSAAARVLAKLGEV